MTRDEIEARIRFIEKRLAEETHPQALANYNRCLETLIMMEAEDDNHARTE